MVQIEFFKENIEPTLPIIRLTKSRNKTTGTATFIFVRPNVFNLMKTSSISLEQMALVWGKNKIITTDLTILFHKGKPFLLKSIFIFKNAQEWFQFLNFMHYYSKETGLSFSESID